MHRWGQSQMFRSLAFYLCEAKKSEKLKENAGRDAIKIRSAEQV